MTIIEYQMPNDLVATGYSLFPQDLEDDLLVLFHATPIKNFQAICAGGFKIPSRCGTQGGGLCSVSFAKRSSTSLTHAMTKRKTRPGDYCIFAVRYQTLDLPSIVENLSDIYDYKLEPQPQIIGYCIIPATYPHS